MSWNKDENNTIPSDDPLVYFTSDCSVSPCRLSLSFFASGTRQQQPQQIGQPHLYLFVMLQVNRHICDLDLLKQKKTKQKQHNRNDYLCVALVDFFRADTFSLISVPDC